MKRKQLEKIKLFINICTYRPFALSGGKETFASQQCKHVNEHRQTFNIFQHAIDLMFEIINLYDIRHIEKSKIQNAKIETAPSTPSKRQTASILRPHR